jgi:hypothetical protein
MGTDGRTATTRSSGLRGGGLALARPAVAVVSTLAALLLSAIPAGAHWEPAATIDNPGAGFAAADPRYQAAVGSNGLATALFFQSTPSTPAGQTGNPFLVRRNPGASGWGAPAAVQTPTGKVDVNADPQLAAGPDGGSFGAFVFDDAANVAEAVATRWAAGAMAPGAAGQMLCTTGGTPVCAKADLQVGVDGAGIGYAVGSPGTFDGNILFATTDGAGAWQPAVIVAQGSNPNLSVNAGGDVVISYARRGTNGAVSIDRTYVKRKLAGEPFGPEHQLSGVNTVDRNDVPSVIDASGNVTVVFGEDAVPPTGPVPQAPVIWAAHWPRANGAPSAAQQLSTTSDGQARASVAAVDPQGRVTAAWHAFSGHTSVFAAERTASGWSAIQHVSPEGSDRNANNPSVAVDALGTATVVYLDNLPPTGSDGDVKASRRASGGGWSPPVSLRSTAAGAGGTGGLPRVAAARAGQADVVFGQQLNGVNRLFATRLDHNYPRPASATPFRVPLVPEYRQCTAPNSTHVAPLSLPSCSSPLLESRLLTTSDVGKGNAFARLAVAPGDPLTAANEADIGISASATDVRRSSDGGDYTGKLILSTDVRITDGANDPAGTETGTVEVAQFAFPIDCAASPNPAAGSACNANTTANTLVPGFAREGRRAVISTLALTVLDMGNDGSIVPGGAGESCPPTCGSGDERVFLREGVFTP